MIAFLIGVWIGAAIVGGVAAWAICRAGALEDAAKAAARRRQNEKAPREGRGAIPSAAGYRLLGDFDVPGRLPADPAGGTNDE